MTEAIQSERESATLETIMSTATNFQVRPSPPHPLGQQGRGDEDPTPSQA
jgi:hypothetical protein